MIPRRCPATTWFCSVGATPGTLKAVVRSGTSRRWPRGWSPAGAGPRSSAPRILVLQPTRPSTASSSSVEGQNFGLSARDGAPAHPTPRSARRGRGRPEWSAVLLPAGHPTAGCGPGPPRTPRAVAGGVPRPHGTGRLVDRTTLRAVALSRMPVHNGVPSDKVGALGARRRQVSGRRRPQRNRVWVRVDATKTHYPSICVVSRLVPHKQIEQAIAAVVQLRGELPDLRLTVVGSGWWEHKLGSTPGDSRQAPQSSSPGTSTRYASKRSTRGHG